MHYFGFKGVAFGKVNNSFNKVNRQAANAIRGPQSARKRRSARAEIKIKIDIGAEIEKDLKTKRKTQRRWLVKPQLIAVAK